MVSPQAPKPSTKVNLAHIDQRSHEQIAASEAVNPLLVPLVNFLHEQGNLTSGIAAADFLRRARGSRVFLVNRKMTEVVQILRDFEKQGYVEVSYSDTTESRPFIVRLTLAGYKVWRGQGHGCSVTTCHPPLALKHKPASSMPGGLALYFMAVLHENKNQLDHNGVKRAFNYFETKNATKPLFIRELESSGWVEVEWTSPARRSVVNVWLLPKGLRQLLGHRCGVNCRGL